MPFVFACLSQGLDANQFHAGLDEICSHFGEKHSDEYLNGLVQDVESANAALFGVMNIASVRRSIYQESRLLNERIVAVSRYIDSCCYVANDEMKASAMVLRQLFGSYKPFTRMKVDSRIGAVSTLLRNLSQPDMQAHVGKLSELSDRIKEIQNALEALKAKRLEVDQANSAAPVVLPRKVLKREAADKLERLVDYLKAMAVKDADTYGGDFAVVPQIITRLNTTRKNKHLNIVVELEDDESEKKDEASELLASA